MTTTSPVSPDPARESSLDRHATGADAAASPDSGRVGRSPGAGWGALRAAAWLAAIVVGNAVTQAALVALDPRMPFSAASLVLAATSAVVLMAAAAGAWRVAIGRADAQSALRRGRPRVAARSAGAAASGTPQPPIVDSSGWLVVRVVVAGVAASAAGVVLPVAAPVVVVVGCAVIAGGGWRGAARVFAQHPARTVLLCVVTIVAVLLAWVADLLLGLLVAGAPAAATAWLASGTASVAVISRWVALARRDR